MGRGGWLNDTYPDPKDLMGKPPSPRQNNAAGASINTHPPIH